MSAKKKPVSTPLHLLQQLTGSLLEHFEQACTQALTDAEKILAKLEKQRVKVQEKLHKQRSKVEAAATAGKAKAQAKAKANGQVLEATLSELQRRQSETRQYIGELKNDIQASLALVQGVGKVREAAANAIEQRAGNGAEAKAARRPAAAKAPATASRVRTATPRALAAREAASPVLAAVEPTLSATKPAPRSRKAPLAKAVATGVDTLAEPTTKRAPRKPRTTAKARPAPGASPAESPTNGATAPEGVA